MRIVISSTLLSRSFLALALRRRLALEVLFQQMPDQAGRRRATLAFRVELGLSVVEIIESQCLPFIFMSSGFVILLFYITFNAQHLISSRVLFFFKDPENPPPSVPHFFRFSSVATPAALDVINRKNFFMESPTPRPRFPAIGLE